MRIVFDLDDTISIHKNRDYKNAAPIEATVRKIRKLKEDGCEIIIYSARGQNSCKGDLQLIEKRNRPQIEEWLRRHDVPCDELVFGKPLADLYVDDKGISLDEFLKADFGKLEGNSGATVSRAGNRVIKKCEDAREEADWYAKAKEIGIKTPKVLSVVLDTINLEYIEGEQGNRKKLTAADLWQIISQIMLMSLHKSESIFDMHGYKNFIKGRLAIAGWENQYEKLFQFLTENESKIQKESTFSHGDLSLSNVIFASQGVFLIDPKPRKEYSTFLNDFAKLRFSLDGGEQLLHEGTRPDEYEDRLKQLDEMLTAKGWNKIVNAMEAAYWIRLLGYFRKNGELETIKEKSKELEAKLSE